MNKTIGLFALLLGACTPATQVDEARGSWQPTGKADELASCAGHCGGRSPGRCWCDRACRSWGDCCPDYAPVCIAPRDGGAPHDAAPYVYDAGPSSYDAGPSSYDAGPYVYDAGPYNYDGAPYVYDAGPYPSYDLGPYPSYDFGPYPSYPPYTFDLGGPYPDLPPSTFDLGGPYPSYPPYSFDLAPVVNPDLGY